VSNISQTPQICWSVWDASPTVSWNCYGRNFAVTLKNPPLAVVDLAAHSLIAIVGSYDDFGSANLLLYSYDGVLKKTLSAPELGLKAHFGRVSETGDSVTASVGFFDKAIWVERDGKLDIENGSMAQLHRSY